MVLPLQVTFFVTLTLVVPEPPMLVTETQKPPGSAFGESRFVMVRASVPFWVRFADTRLWARVRRGVGHEQVGVVPAGPAADP